MSKRQTLSFYLSILHLQPLRMDRCRRRSSTSTSISVNIIMFMFMITKNCLTVE